MNPIQHSRRLAGVSARLAGLAAALVAFGATAAFATRPPPEPAPAHHPALSPWQLTGGYPVPGGVPVHPAVHTVVTGGMAGWQITMIAVAAALLAATVAVLADRARASRRQAATAAA